MALSRPKKKTYFSFASNGTGPAMRMSFGPQRATMAYKSHSKSGLEVLAKYAAMKPISMPASGAATAADAIRDLRSAAAARPGMSLGGIAKAVGLSGAAALAGGGAVAGVSKLRAPLTAGGIVGDSIDRGIASANNGINSIKNKLSPAVNALRQFYGTPAGQMATGGAAALGAYGLARGMLSRPKDEEEEQRGYR